MDAIATLSERISQGNAALVIGTGLSVAAGLPTWEDLLRPLADRAGYKGNDPRGDELLEAAQYYENRYGLPALRSYVRDRLWLRTGLEPTESHCLLAELPINTVFTTSIDSLLEQAYERKGKDVEAVVDSAALAYWDETVVNLVKLHGTLHRCDTYVITEADYVRVYHSDNPLLHKLDALSIDKSFVFLGFDVLDPDFKELSVRVSARSTEHRPPRYFVTLRRNNLDVRKSKRIDELRRRGFDTVILPDGQDWNSGLLPWLGRLLNGVAGA